LKLWIFDATNSGGVCGSDACRVPRNARGIAATSHAAWLAGAEGQEEAFALLWDCRLGTHGSLVNWFLGRARMR
jgi:hypothetical protein